jgi:hypothetical protein
VQSGITLVTHLCSTADDTEICLKFFDVKNLLNSVLDCSLAEQLSPRPVPLIFPSNLLKDIASYGYVGSPSAPVSLHTSFLQGDGSQILLTWRQRYFTSFSCPPASASASSSEVREGGQTFPSSAVNRREDIVSFVIQRGVTDLIVTADTTPLSRSSHHSSATSLEPILTASVPPASVSEDHHRRERHLRNGDGGEYGEDDEGLLGDASPHGFIQFETIGEISFDIDSLPEQSSSSSSTGQRLPTTPSSSSRPRPLGDRQVTPSLDLTLGIPPVTRGSPSATAAAGNAESSERESSESFFEEKDEGDLKSSAHDRHSHSEHSFVFDSYDYPLKLLHFRVKAINRDGMFPPS